MKAGGGKEGWIVEKCEVEEFGLKIATGRF